MEINPEKIIEYAQNHSQPESDLLQELNRETNKEIPAARMLSGHLQGRLLSMISKLIRPKYILEIGTFTGYSALCMAEGLQEDGILHTIDNNEKLAGFQKKYFDRSEYKNQIRPHLGNALDIIPQLDFVFDLVFIDADKRNYASYLEMILPKLQKGSVILSDNVLWRGKVLNPDTAGDKITLALDQYNKILSSHPRLETVLLPVRDGISIARVKN